MLSLSSSTCWCCSKSAERLSLKGELEVAREIQLALLPRGTFTAGDIDISGFTKPANTVGGDFYDVLPQPDGRIILTLGDVAGKGSPAALLMALLLAALRTLVEERLEPADARSRGSTSRFAGTARRRASSRSSTRSTNRPTGRLTYVNAGQNPPLIRRQDGRFERLHGTGIALGLFEHSEYTARLKRHSNPGDLLVFYSDGITEAEDPSGQPLEESGLELVLERHADKTPSAIGAEVLAAVQAHARRARFADDLTILAVKRSA